MLEVLAVDLGHRQAVLSEVSGEFKKGDILFANPVDNADRALSLSDQPYDPASRPPEFALDWLDLFDRKMEMLLKQFLENVHAVACRFLTKIPPKRSRNWHRQLDTQHQSLRVGRKREAARSRPGAIGSEEGTRTTRSGSHRATDGIESLLIDPYAAAFLDNRRPTLSSSWSRWNGLGRNSHRSKDARCLSTNCSGKPDMNRNLTFDSKPRIRSMHSRPFIPGMARSLITN